MKGKAYQSPTVKVKKEQRSKSKKKKEERGPSLLETKTMDLMTMLEKNGCHLKPKESDIKTSRLSPSLADVIKEPVGLGYFLEYLDYKKMRHLLDFFLAATAFRMASQQRTQRRRSSISNGQKISDAKNEFSELHSGMPRVMSTPSACNSLLKDPQLGGNFQSYCARVDYTIPTNETVSRDAKHLQDPWSLSSRPTCHCIDSHRQNTNFSDCWQPFSVKNSDNNARPSHCSDESPHVSTEGHFSRQGRQRTGTTIMDAVTVYARYISLDADYPIGVTSEVRQAIEAEICKNKDMVDPSCFEEAYKVAKDQLERLQREFTKSWLGHIYQWQIVQSNKLTLEDVIYSESSLFYFMEFLDQQGFRAILEFWLMAENFHQNILHKMETRCLNVEESVDDAMALYEKYFSMQSEERLITDDKLRIVLENNICREDGPPSTCFAIPVAYAWTALKEILFPQFLQSDVYKKFLESLLKSSTREEKLDEVTSLSSESMSGSSNVLSSTGDNEIDFLDRNMDSLWYRPAAGRLALGHMDDFGNFVAETEPEPDQDVSKLSKAMNKMLKRRGKSKDKEREREALERARQIIEDIQKNNR